MQLSSQIVSREPKLNFLVNKPFVSKIHHILPLDCTIFGQRCISFLSIVEKAYHFCI